MICVYIYSILLHIMHIFTNRFLVLSENKSGHSQSAFVTCLFCIQMEHTSIDDDCDMPASVMFFYHKAFLT